jgi:hypothetical protein
VSGHAAVWSAIGTVGAAVGTVATLVWAVVSELRPRRDARNDRRIAQVRQVFGRYEDVSGDVMLGNTSEQRVYEVILCLPFFLRPRGDSKTSKVVFYQSVRVVIGANVCVLHGP